MEIAFCKALNDRRLKVVLLLHGTKSEQRLIRKEFARPPIFVADFKKSPTDWTDRTDFINQQF